MARWIETLNTYNFEIRHRPGRQHGNANGLSRRQCFPCSYCSKQDQKEIDNSDETSVEFLRMAKVQDTHETSCSNKTDSAMWYEHKTNQEMFEAQKSDNVLFNLYRLKSDNNNRPEWADVALQDVKLKKYWYQWDRIVLINNVLYRKWINATTEENFGVPCQMHSGQGRQFESGLFKELCAKLKIDKTRTTSFRPQSNGLVERYNRTLENTSSKYISKNQRDWNEQLPWALMAYNSSEHETTKFSSSMLMLGREIQLPVDLIYGPHPQKIEYPDETGSLNDYSVEELIVEAPIIVPEEPIVTATTETHTAIMRDSRHLELPAIGDEVRPEDRFQAPPSRFQCSYEASKCMEKETQTEELQQQQISTQTEDRRVVLVTTATKTRRVVKIEKEVQTTEDSRIVVEKDTEEEFYLDHEEESMDFDFYH
ncbi:unnamed protein product [Mytilus coruscus]|uniref:Integrase catalytic domain-containing protein n=1 Tax=Mytilus coruscus TaxID=42192 RepID=A0A6J8BIZ2_MYTCO|nr:unnamed protein product [Mytilus coruscus]